MVLDRELGTVHESAVLKSFESYLLAAGKVLRIKSRPDPPDALATLDGIETWIEITDAFLDKQHAISTTSSAASDKKHIPDSKRPILNPDQRFKSVLFSVIEKKMTKETMRSCCSQYGPGILLVGTFTPFSSAHKIGVENGVEAKSILSKYPSAVFNEIYLYDGQGEREFQLLYKT